MARVIYYTKEFWKRDFLHKIRGFYSSDKLEPVIMRLLNTNKFPDYAAIKFSRSALFAKVESKGIYDQTFMINDSSGKFKNYETVSINRHLFDSNSVYKKDKLKEFKELILRNKISFLRIPEEYGTWDVPSSTSCPRLIDASPLSSSPKIMNTRKYDKRFSYCEYCNKYSGYHIIDDFLVNVKCDYGVSGLKTRRISLKKKPFTSCPDFIELSEQEFSLEPQL